MGNAPLPGRSRRGGRRSVVDTSRGARAFSRPDAPPPSTFQALFSTVHLGTSYAGPLFTVRRGSDDATLDFHGDAHGNLVSPDGQALQRWLGGALAYVAAWHDQSGNGRHATQATPATQPILDTSKLCLDFRTGRFLNMPDGTVPTGNSRYTLVAHHGILDMSLGGNPLNGSGLIQGGTPGTPHEALMLRRELDRYANNWWSNDAASDVGTYAIGTSIAVTYDQTKRAFFTRAAGGTAYAAAGAITVGIGRASTDGNNYIGFVASGDSSKQFLNGDLHSAYIFNTDLTPAQLEATYVPYDLYASQSRTLPRRGATGNAGPNVAQTRSTYAPSTPWANLYVSENVSRPGIQLWTVPSTGLYRITAVAPAGLQHAKWWGPPEYDGTTATTATFSRGANVAGTFALTKGSVLQILVGQCGQNQFNVSGSGGTFVATLDNAPLLVAGGGGGMTFPTGTLSTSAANASTSGNPGSLVSGAATLAGGSGGSGGATQNIAIGGFTGNCGTAGGGGFTGNGGSEGGGFSFTSGGGGGFITFEGGAARHVVGGFGGGGASRDNTGATSGGGGGYSGGGGSSSAYGSARGGGGGSFNSGLDQVNQGGHNPTYEGFVVVRRVDASVPLVSFAGVFPDSKAVTVSWTSVRAAAVRVSFRTSDEQPFVQVGEYAAGTSSMTLSGLTPLAAHTFRLVPVGASGAEGPAITAAVSTLPEPMVHLHADDLGAAGTPVSWANRSTASGRYTGLFVTNRRGASTADVLVGVTPDGRKYARCSPDGAYATVGISGAHLMSDTPYTLWRVGDPGVTIAIVGRHHTYSRSQVSWPYIFTMFVNRCSLARESTGANGQAVSFDRAVGVAMPPYNTNWEVYILRVAAGKRAFLYHSSSASSIMFEAAAGAPVADQVWGTGYNAAAKLGGPVGNDSVANYDYREVRVWNLELSDDEVAGAMASLKTAWGIP